MNHSNHSNPIIGLTSLHRKITQITTPNLQNTTTPRLSLTFTQIASGHVVNSRLHTLPHRGQHLHVQFRGYSQFAAGSSYQRWPFVKPQTNPSPRWNLTCVDTHSHVHLHHVSGCKYNYITWGWDTSRQALPTPHTNPPWAEGLQRGLVSKVLPG